MTAIELYDQVSGSKARISPEHGFNCFSFKAGVVGFEPIDVLDAPDDFEKGNYRASAYGIPLLFPFPNRIRQGRYDWDGKTYELDPNKVMFDGTGNAIHGFCLDRPWRVLKYGDHCVIGEFQLSKDAPDRRNCWPADFRIEVHYELRGPSLRCEILIHNPDVVPLPWGFGTHPYFRYPLCSSSPPSKCLAVIPAHEMWELENCLPTGRRLPIPEELDIRDGEYLGALKLDDVFTKLEPTRNGISCVLMDEQAGLQVSQLCDLAFREIVVYTPPGRQAVCFEPYTCVTDAINLEWREFETGWRTLAPGESFRTWIEITAGPILA